MNIDNIKIGGVYSYTNKNNYTTRIIVLAVNNKSVFYRWANDEFLSMNARMSLNSFKDFTLEF